MKKIIKVAFIISVLCAGLLGTTVIKAEDTAMQLLNEALTNKTLYSFNNAYKTIMNIQDEGTRDQLLSKLSTISSTVYTEDILHYIDLLTQVANTGSGRIYAQTEEELKMSTINDTDKNYLLGELSSWGLKLVYTQDYVNGLNALGNAWKNKDLDSISKADRTIKLIKNQFSREYLLEELEKVKGLGDTINIISIE
jgi:hypothetical protein